MNKNDIRSNDSEKEKKDFSVYNQRFPRNLL